MYIKQDYDFEELKQFINNDNMQIYQLIEENNQQDNFNLFVEKYLKGTPTPEELNNFLANHKTLIKYYLKLK